VPRVIDCPAEESLELAELVELLETGGFDAADEDNFASWGVALRRLANNRSFLAEMMMTELKQRCAGQLKDNQYSAQVVLLHAHHRSNFLLRANFWPSLKDSVVRHSGTDPFVYGMPHDHNFSFLTVGYLGPGYWSDYYEYDHTGVVGYPGEAVDLRFVETSRLEPGKVMLYRAHKDIHRQLPADAMSVSLNILESSQNTAFRDQYQFDLEGSRIAGIMTRTSLEPMLALTAHYGGEDGEDLLRSFAASHPSDRVRWAALKAQADAAGDLDDRIAVFERGLRADSLLVGAMARQQIDRLEAMRAWLAAAPADGAV
jgi:hypothetical protein